jgi:hypothetical protein
MRFLARYYIALLVLVGGLAYTAAIGLGFDSAIAVLGACLLALISAATLERRLPFRADWNQAQSDTRTDLISAGV